MFDFFLMANNHDQRIIDRYEVEDLVVDTCYVNDALNPYETGISHTSYNDGKWVIVEDYANKEDAQKGHNKWVEIMTEGELPKELKDIASSMIAQFSLSLGNEKYVFQKAD